MPKFKYSVGNTDLFFFFSEVQMTRVNISPNPKIIDFKLNSGLPSEKKWLCDPLLFCFISFLIDLFYQPVCTHSVVCYFDESAVWSVGICPPRRSTDLTNQTGTLYLVVFFFFCPMERFFTLWVKTFWCIVITLVALTWTVHWLLARA